MSELLLPTKLFVPPQRLHLTPRPRLINRLNEGIDHKLTLVAAPAGFGKTTLVTSWLASDSGRPAAWLSLDENDNLFPRFFAYFIAAAQTVYPDLAKGLLSSLQSAQAPGDEAILSALLHELATFDQPLQLVLDDYHAIDNEAIHEALGTIVDYMPPSLHLVVTSRESPPLPLPRWRVRGQLTEIGAADLRFTVEEAVVFMTQTMGLELDESAVAALERRTEGWVAGLQLAALSLRGSPDSGRFIADFDGGNRHVAGYLLEEVLQRQPPEIQTFLLHTAILERFCGPLCDAVTNAGQSSSHASPSSAILEQLEKSDLFLIPLDAHRRWYRYHHLFAGLLQDRLQREQGQAQINDLHRRASQWFAAEGLLDEAIHHAIQTLDFDEAARLMATITGEQLWDLGNISLLKKWGPKIPDAVYRNYPRAATIVAAAELVTGDFRYLYHHLELIADMEAVRGEYALFQSILVRNQGDFVSALHLAREAGEFLAEDDVAMRAMALMQMALNMFQIGELSKAEKALLQTRQILGTRKSPGLNMELQVIHMQALTNIEKVDFQRAAQLFQEGIALAEQALENPPVMIGAMQAWLGRVYYEWNKLEKAADYYDQARDWGDRTGITDITMTTLVGEIDLLCQRGDAEGVRPKLDMLRAMTGSSQLKDAISQMEAVIAAYHLRLGQLEKALHWANTAGLNMEDRPEFTTRYYYSTLIAVRLAEYRTTGNTKKIPQILNLLDHFLQTAHRGGYSHTAVELLILQAMALDLVDGRPAAIQTLQRAIEIAEPGHLVRTFLDNGPALAPLLAGCDGAYARRLYEALVEDLEVNGLETAVPTSLSPPPLSPPHDLTPREFEVLQAIIAGLSNKDIEEKLVISHNTVRTHIKNLYSKLHVSSRTQAVKKARELGVAG